MPTEGNNEETPIRSAIEIAMAGQRPMDSTPPVETSNNAPIQTALEKAMAGQRPPITHNSTQEEVLPWVNSQGSGQNPVNLGKLEGTLEPSTEEVKSNWEKSMSNTPSIVVATEKKAGSSQHIQKDETKTDFFQEARGRNVKANKGFTGGFTQTGTNALRSQDTIADLAKSNASLEEEKRILIERLDRMQETLDKLVSRTTQYDSQEALDGALDPNRVRPLDPLEDVKNKTITEQNKKAQEFVNQVKTEDKLHNPLSTQTATGNVPTPTETPTTNPVEITKSPDQAKRERRLKTAAFIAGAVVGTTGGVLGGSATSLVGVAACTVLGYASRGLDKLATSRGVKLDEKINQLTDGPEKDKLITRKANWEKVQGNLVYVKQFLKGAGIGFSASGLAMGIMNGGHGLAWNRPEIIPTGGLSTGGAEASSSNVGANLGGAEAAAESYPGNSFIHDGRVDLPGSAWDGNFASGPAQDILPGGADNFSNYAGGQYDMAASRLGEDLANYKVTDSLLSNLATPDKHQLLNQYLRAIQSGNTNPDLIEALKGMNSEGATKLLQALGQ